MFEQQAGEAADTKKIELPASSQDEMDTVMMQRETVP
jgi:hypothetical protein